MAAPKIDSLAAILDLLSYYFFPVLSLTLAVDERCTVPFPDTMVIPIQCFEKRAPGSPFPGAGRDRSSKADPFGIIAIT